MSAYDLRIQLLPHAQRYHGIVRIPRNLMAQLGVKEKELVRFESRRGLSTVRPAYPCEGEVILVGEDLLPSIDASFDETLNIARAGFVPEECQQLRLESLEPIDHATLKAAKSFLVNRIVAPYDLVVCQAGIRFQVVDVNPQAEALYVSEKTEIRVLIPENGPTTVPYGSYLKRIRALATSLDVAQHQNQRVASLIPLLYDSACEIGRILGLLESGNWTAIQSHVQELERILQIVSRTLPHVSPIADETGRAQTLLKASALRREDFEVQVRNWRIALLKAATGVV